MRVDVAVAVVFFDQAKVDAHLAHRSGHYVLHCSCYGARRTSLPPDMPVRAQTPTPVTLAESRSLRPSNAEPIRTCVAPYLWRSRSRRSCRPDIAPPGATRAPRGELGQPREGASAGCSSGATAITPSNRSRSSAATWSASAASRRARRRAPDRRRGSPERTPAAAPVGRSRLGQCVRDRRAVDGVDGSGVARTERHLFVCSRPTKCSRGSRAASRRIASARIAGAKLGQLGSGLLVAALGDVGDAEAEQDRDVAGRKGLGHRDQVTDHASRPAAAAASAIRRARGQRGDQFCWSAVIDRCAHC